MLTAGTDPGYLDTAAFNSFIDQESLTARRYVATLPTNR